jgi:hypothetical protein
VKAVTESDTVGPMAAVAPAEPKKLSGLIRWFLQNVTVFKIL